MKVLVSGATAETLLLMAARPDRVGALMTPRSGNRIAAAVNLGADWACDNDCFQGLHPVRWLRFLAKIVESGHRPLWVSCPDVVSNAGETWTLYDRWAPVLRSLGLPVALVLQDGLERLKWRARLPWVWDEIDAVFVGGSTKWKEGPHAADLIAEAKRRGKWVHVGRCTTERRIIRFVGLGADSIDGAEVARQQAKFVPLLIKWIDRAERNAKRQPRFTEALA
jgi:hypothetical protein